MKTKITTKNRKVEYSFIFICQQGDLEVKSLLLAASLKRFLRCSHELVAAIPEPSERWGMPHRATLKLLKTMGIRLVHITNRISPDYPIGNKISCLCIPTQAEKRVLLDSDILCMRRFSGDDRFRQPFNAKPADIATVTTDEEYWRTVYEVADAAMPTLRMPATVSGDFMPPYFNAGFVAVLTNIGLGETWLECCLRIENDPRISQKRPYLDQLGLAVAVRKLGLPFDCLDERFNYPVHLKPLEGCPFFCHYHRPDIIQREPALLQLVQELAQGYPVLRELMSGRSEWAPLLEHRKKSCSFKESRFLRWMPESLRPLTTKFGSRLSAPRGKDKKILPEVVITGIPRSGTSYLCNLLHRVEDCVVINEPQEIFEPLSTQRVPWEIGILYRELRRDILAGKPVKNKLHEGKVVEDTAHKDEITTYLPSVSSEDFILATKNTLAYLVRLEALQRAMPNALFVACIRNPLDTVASWKTSFPHLRDADLNHLPVGHPEDPFLSSFQRESSRYILRLGDAAERRAVLWRYLAELILMNKKNLLLVPYADLVTKPDKVLGGIFEACTGRKEYRTLEEIRPSKVRGKRSFLDDADIQAVNAICSQVGADLGLSS